MFLPAKKRVCFLLVVVMVVGLPSVSLAMMIKMELPAIWQSSRLAVHGSVAKLESKWVSDESGNHIHTFATLRVQNATDDSKNGVEIVIDTLGGRAGDLAEWVEDEPVFTMGEEVVVFLSEKVSTGIPRSIVIGLWQGKFPVENGQVQVGRQAIPVGQLIETLQQAKKGNPLAWWALAEMDKENMTSGTSSVKQPTALLISLAASSISDINPSIASAGTDSIVTIVGSGFEPTQGAGKVEFFYRSGKSLISAPILGWSNNQIICTVPIGLVDGYAASTSSGPVTVTPNSGATNASTFNAFRVSFGFGGQRWNGLNPKVDYYIGANIAQWTEAIHGAANTWNPAAAINLNDAGTTTDNTASRNNKNEVMYSPLDAGVLGRASYWYNPDTNMMVECDLVLNSTMNWGTGAQIDQGIYDVWSITLHEMGHWLVLRDLYGGLYIYEPYDLNKVMYGISGSGKQKRNLHPDDAAGARYIYGDRGISSLGEWLNGNIFPIPFSSWCSDVNGDGRVDAIDLVILLQAVSVN